MLEKGFVTRAEWKAHIQTHPFVAHNVWPRIRDYVPAYGYSRTEIDALFEPTVGGKKQILYGNVINLVAGAIPYGTGATGLAGATANLFYDAANQLFGVREGAPTARVHVNSVGGNIPCLNLEGGAEGELVTPDGQQLRIGHWNAGTTTFTERMKMDDAGLWYVSYLTAASVVFAGAGGELKQDNANFRWDNTLKRLGLGTIGQAGLHVALAGVSTGGTAATEVVALFENATAARHTAISINAQSGRDPILYLAEADSAVWDIRNDASATDKFNIRYQVGGANATYFVIDNAGNIGISQASFGTNMTKGLAQATGVAPTTSPADCFQMYSADVGGVAGKAGMHIRDEVGEIWSIGNGQFLCSGGAISLGAGNLSTTGNIYTSWLQVKKTNADAVALFWTTHPTGDALMTLKVPTGRWVQWRVEDDGGYEGRIIYDTGAHTFSLQADSAAGGVIVKKGDNLGISTSTFGTNMTKGYAQVTGVAPTTSPADMFQMYSADIGGVAGKAGVHFRGEDNNIVSIGSGGVLMSGTARVLKCHQIANAALGKGGTKPDEVIVGNYWGWSYDINDDSVFSVRLPNDWAPGTDVLLYIRWAINEAYVTNSGEVRWQATWSAVPGDATEAIGGAGTTDDSGDINIPATAYFLTQNLVETIPAASLAAGDELGITLKRIALVGGNNPTADPVVTCVGIVYTADKMGLPT